MAAAAAAAESGGAVDALGLDLEARKVPDPAGRAPDGGSGWVVVLGTGWVYQLRNGFTVGGKLRAASR